MKEKSALEIDRILVGVPDNLIRLIESAFDAEHFNKKIASGKTLVKMGRKILPHLHKLVKSEDPLIRREAAKLTELIAGRTSIPFFIHLLSDTDFDIRWIAAEGLIKIGRRSIKPVLRAVRDGDNSILLNEGAHHVLVNLFTEKEKKNEETLLLTLENYHTLGGTAPVEASIALETIS
jgi:HEAT repeat protein